MGCFSLVVIDFFLADSYSKVNFCLFVFVKLLSSLKIFSTLCFGDNFAFFSVVLGITSDGVSRLGLGLETCLETRFLESRSWSRSRTSQVSSRSRTISVSVSSPLSRDFAHELFV